MHEMKYLLLADTTAKRVCFKTLSIKKEKNCVAPIPYSSHLTRYFTWLYLPIRSTILKIYNVKRCSDKEHMLTMLFRCAGDTLKTK